MDFNLIVDSCYLIDEKLNEFQFNLGSVASEEEASNKLKLFLIELQDNLRSSFNLRLSWCIEIRDSYLECVFEFPDKGYSFIRFIDFVVSISNFYCFKDGF